MAVYTHVNDTALAAFLQQYDVGQVTSFKGIAEGVENSNYFLQTTTGTFVLTLYEKRTNPENLPYFLAMMEHLADAGLPSPRPVRDRHGVALKTLEGRPACLISFLKGISVDAIGVEHCGAVGDMLARMHCALKDFTPERPNSLSLTGWQELAAATLPRADELQPGLAKLITDELACLTDNWPENLPSGTIHADLFPDNILFSGAEITGLIDFYFACSDSLAYDVAVCINAWAFDENHIFRPERAKRLSERYDIIRQLTGDELEALPLLCRGAALRFLLTRLYDWQNRVDGAVVSVKDPLDYVKRLKFHQRVRNAADYVF